MTRFWMDAKKPERRSRGQREAAAAIRDASAAVERERPDLAQRLRELAAELEVEADGEER